MKTILFALLLINGVSDQEIQFNLSDGSVVKGIFESEIININVKYGSLIIPTKDIKKIEFGFHYPIGIKESVDQHYSDLFKSDFKSRDLATSQLIKLGRWSYPKIIKSFEKENDLEVSKRIKTVKEVLDEQVILKYRNMPLEDKIHIGDSVFCGIIKEDYIQIKSKTLGDLKVHISNLEQSINKTIEAKSIKVNGHPDDWMDTGFYMEVGSSVNIEAKGILDIWSQTPGQFTCGPSGNAGTVGKNQRYKAGALIAKIGNTEYVVGDSTVIRPNESGNIFLSVIATPWNNPISGSYQVIISR